MTQIFGLTIDSFGRCVHYHSAVDIVANKCYSCKKYYACFSCHNELENHSFEPWPIEKKTMDKVVLCGACQHEMTYFDYQSSEKCRQCQQPFNLNCMKHHAIYFSEKN
ncbi:CHY zinc finger protein [Isobaculum melis]|uniref:Uncharacterized protein, contains Zn-finger domain of CHY type n=1 Tax=Isobaculum melis TaxID=142588 RepID=A0A1H9S0L1_9LACT|nr:CHY zinc finger protein [Isobaculum melis]SER78527.1 Uncharacterized protein, contains Zn-finger domain of CHY type [Isobaculum melis]